MQNMEKTESEETKKSPIDWGMISKYRSEIMGVSVLWIWLFHFYGDLPKMFPDPVVGFIKSGNVGVEIFLFVSGVGLFFSYQKERNLKAFFRKRYVRILVPYFFLAGAFFLWRDIFLSEDPLVFFKNLTQWSFFETGEGNFWYVPTIALFYLMFPLIYRLMYGKDQMPDIRKKIDPSSMFFILFTVWSVFCLILVKAAPEFWKNTEIMFTRLPAFLLGCVIGKWVYEKRRMPNALIVGSVSFFVYFFTCFYGKIFFGEYWGRVNRIPIAFSIMLLTAYILYRLHPKGSRILRFLGERSLEYYLLEMIVERVWRYYASDGRWLSSTGRLDYLVIILITLAIGAAVHPLFNAIIKRLGGKRPSAIPV